MKNILEILKHGGLKIFRVTQTVLMSSALFFIYFFVFGWFALFARWLERSRLEKDGLSMNSFWLKSSLKTPDKDSWFNQS